MFGLIPCFPFFRRTLVRAASDGDLTPDAGDANARDEGLACNGRDSEPHAPDRGFLSY
jgi:hypothetical protein